MGTVVKWVAITAAINCHHAHSISDETTVSGVSLEGIGLRLCDEHGRKKDLILEGRVLPDGQSSAGEFNAIMQASRITVGDRTIEVPHGKVVSGISDNAPGAKNVNDLYRDHKAALYANLAGKENLSDEQKDIWEAWDTLKCEGHKIALWSCWYVGGRRSSKQCSTADEKGEAEAAEKNTNPDKLKMIHGSVEFQVQWRLAALPHVLRTLNNIIGLSTLGGTVHGVEPVVEWHKRCWECVPINCDLMLLRWGFNRIQAAAYPRQTMFKEEALTPISMVLYAISKLFSSRGDHKDYYPSEEKVLHAFRKDRELQNLDDIPSFKGSRMNWLTEVKAPISSYGSV